MKIVILSMLYLLSNTLSFNKNMHDFGIIKANKTYYTDFEIINTGNTAISILNVSTTCGCTVAKYPSIIKPNGKGVISATLDTKGLSGEIERRLIVVTNGKQEYFTLTLKGVIK